MMVLASRFGVVRVEAVQRNIVRLTKARINLVLPSTHDM